MSFSSQPTETIRNPSMQCSNRETSLLHDELFHLSISTQIKENERWRNDYIVSQRDVPGVSSSGINSIHQHLARRSLDCPPNDSFSRHRSCVKTMWNVEYSLKVWSQYGYTLGNNGPYKTDLICLQTFFQFVAKL